MKKILGLLLILAVVILGAYYGMGMVTERAVKQNLDVINASNNGLVVDLDTYQRGWFHSTATLNWRLHLPERLTTNDKGEHVTVPAQDYNVQMPLHVAHGPFIFANKGMHFGLGFAYTDLDVPAQYMDKFNQVFTDASVKPKLAITLYVNYLNKSTLNIDVPNFKLITKQNAAQFNWLGMTTGVKISSNLNHYNGTMVINGFEFSMDKNNVTMGKLLSEYDFERSAQGLYLGEANMSLPSFVISQDKQKLFELQKWRFDTSSKVKDGLFDTELSSSLEKLYANGKVFGPVEIKIVLRNLDAEVLAKINQASSKLQQVSDEERQQVMLSLLPELPKLFTKGAEFAIEKCTVAVPEGTLEAKLLVAMPAGDLDNPFQMMQKVKGNGRLAIPASMLQELLMQSARQRLQSAEAVSPASDTASSAQPSPSVASDPATLETNAKSTAEQMLNGMINSGFIVKQGSDYVIESELKEGQLQINGKPFNPAMLNF